VTSRNSSLPLVGRAQRRERLLEDTHLVGGCRDRRHVDDGARVAGSQGRCDGAHDANESSAFALRLALGDPVVTAGEAEALAVERNEAERQLSGLESFAPLRLLDQSMKRLSKPVRLDRAQRIAQRRIGQSSPDAEHAPSGDSAAR